MIRDIESLLSDKTIPKELRRQVEELRSSLRKTWADLETEAHLTGTPKKEAANKPHEAATKTVAGKSYPASDFLVVEDPEAPTTWHLQVRRNGTPDHNLMGAAWAALHGGYRGNKYEGPNKSRATAALKKLYDSEDMAVPAEGAAEPVLTQSFSEAYALDVKECGADSTYQYIPYGVTSFAQLQQVKAAQEVAHEIGSVTQDYQQILGNILYTQTDAADKVELIRNLTDEFVLMLEMVSMEDEGESSPIMPVDEEEAAADPEEEEPVAETFAESFTSEPLVELAGEPRSPVELDLQLIRPGWGNTRDNHYYPAAMLKRDAHVFEGAKMYTTDHKPEEKSVRTEVAVIKNIQGFTEEGAPVGRVVVFDPTFAEQVRNRAAAGVLSTLECSILADGKARPGFEEGGRKGKVVESITSVSSVDWVTKAGAGGKALNLVESEEGSAEDITDEGGDPVSPSGEIETTPVESSSTPEAELPATISEDGTAEPVAAAVTETVTEPVQLERSVIAAELSKTNLPAASVTSLVLRDFSSLEELAQAISSEVERIKQVTGSGRPFALGESAAAKTATQPVTRALVEASVDAVNSRYGFGRSK
jgi:hypothetical protein